MCFASLSGMYVTIPIMHVALFLLSIERAVSYSGSDTILTKLVAGACVTQMILCFVWALSITAIIAWISLKDHFTRVLFENQFTSVLQPAVDEIVNQLGRRSYRCSIDGRLPAGFKIVLLIVYILLTIAIVKPLIISIGVQRLTPSCCQRAQAKATEHGSRATLSFIAILLLNIFLSLPFYVTSIFTSVFSQFDASKATFSKTLRICFLLRLLSILFQCSVFYLLDEEPCPVFTKCINCAIGPDRRPSNPTTRQKLVPPRKMIVEDQNEIHSIEEVSTVNGSVETISADEIVEETKVVTLTSKATNKRAPVELPTQKKSHVDGNNSDDLYANSLLGSATSGDSSGTSSSDRPKTPPIRRKCVRPASSRPKRITKTPLPSLLPKSRAVKSTSRSNQVVLSDENSDVE